MSFSSAVIPASDGDGNIKETSSSPVVVTILPEYHKTSDFIEFQASSSYKREDIDDSFYVCDLGEVMERHLRWKRVFPRLQPYYSVKCNTDSAMRRLLTALGAGFDCGSKEEIKETLALGAKPSDIIFANPFKQISHLQYAKDVGVKQLVFDSEEELIKLKKCYAEAQLILRIATDDSGSIAPLSVKFGARMKHAPSLIAKARELDLHISGICFHVGSDCRNVLSYEKSLQDAKMLFNHAENLGFKLKILDIGGGFPGHEDVELKFETLALHINGYLDKIFPETCYKDVRIVAEPGRYYAKSPFTLATNIIGKRNKVKNPTNKPYSRSIHWKYTYGPPATDEDEMTKNVDEDSAVAGKDSGNVRTPEETFMYYLSTGMFGAFIAFHMERISVKLSLLRPIPSNCKLHSCSIWGPVNNGLDRLVEHALLPELEIGDWIIWHEAGAYTIGSETSFCGLRTREPYYVVSATKLKDLERSVEGGKIPTFQFLPSEIKVPQSKFRETFSKNIWIYKK